MERDSEVSQHRPGVVTSLVMSRKLEEPSIRVPLKLDLDYLDELLAYCIENKVTDLSLQNGDKIIIVAGGNLYRFGDRKFYLSEIQDLLGALVNDPNAAMEIARAEPRDFSYIVSRGLKKPVRFRCCATGCLAPGGGEGIEIIFRPTGKDIPTHEQLGIEQYIVENSQPDSGIVIVTGPTGSGKTTLLDSLLRRNLTGYPAKRIITYYAPIENDLNDIPGITGQVIQSDIGRAGHGAHIKEWYLAVRNMLRRHPDQVVFGEARDRETIDGAVMASMSAHTTYTTSHTSSVHMTIPRMVDAFPANERIRITNALIDNCRLIVHQRLLRNKDGHGLVAVRSALAFNQDIRHELLRSSIDRVPLLIKEATEQQGLSLLKSAEAQFNLGNIDESTLYGIERELKSEFLG